MVLGEAVKMVIVVVEIVLAISNRYSLSYAVSIAVSIIFLKHKFDFVTLLLGIL